MSRPEFPIGTILPANCIHRIREEQEQYDRDPELAEREQQEDRERAEDEQARERYEEQQEIERWHEQREYERQEEEQMRQEEGL